ncbi:uncharacterized protein LOC119074029 [Bradysia coprophila]|uniref:uncharacterized protein LOC119074029 n=1 Tax=Bradysia coprophila TaxID=38358 RepID=UPI00187DB6D2|nr:uncharacterized protein LOC119074029 [Bradysia coprophila]
MFAKLLFLMSCCMFIEIGYCGNSNEHVHIKLHVPEIIKRHTHVRTVYKHLHKPKPHKSKKSHAKLKHSHFDVAESRPIWIPKPVHYKPKAKEETVPINEWQHKLAMQSLKKPKHSKQSPYALIEMMAETGDDGYKAKLYKQYQLQEQLRNQQMMPDYMVMDGSLSFGAEEDDNDDVYASSPSVEHFHQPHLMKITEADIRPKVKPAPQWDHDSKSQEIAYYKKPHEWPKVEPSSVAYQYTTLAPLHLTDDEFVPSALLQQTKHSSLDEYPNLFQSNKPKPMDLQYTYTKYKNRQSMKNAMSNLNTRVN